MDKLVEGITREIEEVQKDTSSFRYLSTSFKEGYLEGLKRALVYVENTDRKE